MTVKTNDDFETKCYDLIRKFVENSMSLLEKANMILPELKLAEENLTQIINYINEFGESEEFNLQKIQKQHKLDSIQMVYNKTVMPYNAVEPTFHFVVIDGKGYDVNKKRYYYHFLEVGTENNMNGTNEDNRLYIYNTEIKGTRGYDAREYIVTEVRKHGLSGSACP